MERKEYMWLSFQDGQVNEKEKKRGNENDEMECKMYVGVVVLAEEKGGGMEEDIREVGLGSYGLKLLF